MVCLIVVSGKFMIQDGIKNSISHNHITCRMTHLPDERVMSRDLSEYDLFSYES